MYLWDEERPIELCLAKAELKKIYIVKLLFSPCVVSFFSQSLILGRKMLFMSTKGEKMILRKVRKYCLL